MTTAVKSLINSFDQLSPPEKREAIAEILRRSTDLESPSLSDEELTAVADELFLQLDAAEAADESA